MTPYPGRRLLLSAGLVAALALSTVVAVPAGADEPPGKPDSPAAEAEPRADGLIVQYADDASPVTAAGEVTGSGRVDDVQLEAGVPIGFDLVTVEFDETLSADAAETAAAQLEASPAVVFAEPNYLVSIDSAESTQTVSAWNLDRIDQRSSRLNHRYGYDTAGKGVSAYVIDTGVLAKHAEFGGRVASGFTSIHDGRGTTDCNGHGTHVSGTIAGATYGVAKAATIVPVRVLSCQGEGSDASVIAGINWVINHHKAGKPAVANISLGGSYSASLNKAVARMIEDGVTVAVASGNDAEDACASSPASVETAITVNASERHDNAFYWSNYGPCTDIYAPGVDVLSAWKSSRTATMSLTGTSMAAPHVAGVAARLLGGRPKLTPAQVWEAIDAAATPIDFTFAEYGDPNKLLFAPSLQVRRPAVVVTGTPQVGQQLRSTTGAWDSGVVKRYAWYRSGAVIPGATASTYAVTDADVGSRISVTITGSRAGYVTESSSSDKTAIAVGRTSSAIGVDTSDSSVCVLHVTGTVQCDGTVAGLGNAVSVSAATDDGDTVGCSVTAATAVMCWGSDDHAEAIALTGALSVVTGGDHACALVAGGAVRCWGDNGSGQLGDGSTNFSDSPTTAGISGAVAVSAGDLHTCAVAGGGGVWCWGDGNPTPAQIGGVTGAVDISIGDSEACALLADGHVTCWGSDLAPAGVAGIENATSVAVGGAHACAVLSGGALACWGDNGSGQLGVASPDSEPVTVPGLGAVAQVSAGADHTCAVTVSDRLYCWGSDSTGLDDAAPTAMTGFGVDLAARPVPTVSGSALVGRTLTAHLGTWTSGVSVKRQWLRSGVPIPGATNASYRAISADAGKRLTVRVTATKPGYRDAIVTSKPTSLLAR